MAWDLQKGVEVFARPQMKTGMLMRAPVMEQAVPSQRPNWHLLF